MHCCCLGNSRYISYTWGRHDMEALSSLLAILWKDSPGRGRSNKVPVMHGSVVSLFLAWISFWTQSSRRWFETPRSTLMWRIVMINFGLTELAAPIRTTITTHVANNPGCSLGDRFKKAHELLNFDIWMKHTTLKIWVKYSVWNFKRYHWHSTQNILRIQWKMGFLYNANTLLQKERLYWLYYCICI